MSTYPTPQIAPSEATTAEESIDEHQSPYLLLYWIASEISLIILTLFSIYLVACLSRYALLTRCKPGREVGGKKGKILYQLCLCASIMAMGRFVADHSVALVGWKSDSSCVIAVGFSAVFYSLSLYPVYIFLWMRQSLFYSNPVLSHVLNPAITCFSWATLVLMLSGGLVLTTLYVIPEVTGWEYKATKQGCEDVAGENGFDVVTTVLAVFTVSFQICLLILFVYPLLSKKTQRYRSAGAAKSAKHGHAGSSTSDAPDANDGTPSDSYSTSHANGNLQPESEDQNDAIETGDELKSEFSSSNEPIISNSTECTETECKKNGKVPAVNIVDSKSANVMYRNNFNTKESKQKLCKFKRNSSTLKETMKKRKRDHAKRAATALKKSKRSRTQQGRRVMLFIRKAFLLTLTCVLSDVVFAVIQQVVVLPELVYLVLFDVNLLINIICIIMSFRDWPKMIFPLCAGFDKRKRSDSTCIEGATNGTKLPIVARRAKLSRSNGNPSPQLNDSYNDSLPVKV